MAVEFSFAVDTAKLKLNPIEERVIDEQGFAPVFENILSGALQTKYQQGLTGPKLKSLNRILRKLDTVDGTASTIELESAELDLVKEAFGEDIPVQPAQVRIFSLYQEEVERCVEVLKETE